MVNLLTINNSCQLIINTLYEVFYIFELKNKLCVIEYKSILLAKEILKVWNSEIFVFI